MSSTPVPAATNLFDFFRSHVGSAVKDTGTPVSDGGVCYLASLLAERSVAAESPTKTLAELHLAGVHGDTATAIRSYKALGDRALVTVGFFRESLRSGVVGAAYSEDMGASAYARLSVLLRGGGEVVRGGLEAIFSELAGCFGGCARVLHEVRSSIAAETNAESDADVLALYEQWLESGSPALARKLQDLGVVPLRPVVHPVG